MVKWYRKGVSFTEIRRRHRELKKKSRKITREGFLKLITKVLPDNYSDEELLDVFEKLWTELGIKEEERHQFIIDCLGKLRTGM